MVDQKRTVMRRTVGLLTVLSLFGLVEPGFAGENSPEDKNEFLGVDLLALMKVELGDLNPMGIHHTHEKGEIMVGYTVALMQMEGNRDGHSRVSVGDVLTDFMVAPTEMTTTMQMFGMMYSPSDRITIMAMVPYAHKSMKHINRASVTFKTSSEGPGDVKTSLLYQIHRTEQHLVYLSGGIGFPTGSISARDTTPSGNVRLPYPMQLGSGTFDLLPGIAY